MIDNKNLLQLIHISTSNFSGYNLNVDDGDIKAKGNSSSDTFTQNKNSANVFFNRCFGTVIVIVGYPLMW